MYVIDSMQAIEVTQNESLKRSLNDLLETLPGGGIVQVRSGSTVWRNITQ
jgi:phage baseplate assembly protein W